MRRRDLKRFAYTSNAMNSRSGIWCRGTLLGLACGVGYGTARLSRDPQITHAVGVDISAAAVEYAIKRYHGKGDPMSALRHWSSWRRCCQLWSSIFSIYENRRTFSYASGPLFDMDQPQNRANIDRGISHTQATGEMLQNSIAGRVMRVLMGPTERRRVILVA